MDYRESLFKEAKEVDLSFMHMDIFEQFVFLMSNFQKPVMKFLNKAISRRSYYITKSAVLQILCPKGPLCAEVQFIPVQSTSYVK